jgi:hypothetical protein
VTDLKTNKKLGRIAFQPHMLPLGKLKAGSHSIAITAFGNRYNSFGHVHLSEGAASWCGPNMWRTGGDWWTDKYNIKPIGVLECPKILVGHEEVADDVTDDEMTDDVKLREVYGGWVTVSRVKPEEKVSEGNDEI